MKLLNEEEEPIIRTAVTYAIEGTISDEEFAAIKKHCINPVDSRETGLEKPETLVQSFPEPEDVKIFDGFRDTPEAKLKELYDSLNLAMTFKDFLHIQNYFKNDEKRDPSMTEIRVLDTYWSDHCRHTTFSTELKNVAFDDGYYCAPMKETYEDYLNTHKNLYAGRSDKFVCLMDLALMAMKRLKKEGKLQDQEESDMFHLKAIEIISRSLRGAVENTPEGREGMALGQYVAGMGFSNVGLGIVHSMAHPLGALYDTPHGIANAIILPTVMEYNAEATGEKYRDIAKAMGVEGTENMSQEEYSKAAVDAVRKLSQDVGIPADLKEIVKKEDIPFLAQSAYDDACRPGNPKETSVEDITKLYESLL